VSPPRVYLVGAGPGNTGLLTLRAVECLQLADLVLYDRLVSPRMLAFAPRARKVCVTELADCHAERIPHVHQTMIEAAAQGQIVVRLKGGDPLLFGRGAEEAEALREAGIAFEIVPGVTAALGAAAFAGIPLTDRRLASAVALVTGHEDPAKPDSLLDWHALAHFPGTLVFYMGQRRLDHVVQRLIEHGKSTHTPVAVVHWATLGRQKTVEATLQEIAVATRDAGITAPAVTIVGDVVSLRQKVSWVESRPLLGRTVLVTRPAGQEAELVRRLENLGAEVMTQPTVVIGEPDDWRPVDEALANLDVYQWLVFTSVNGVHFFLRRLRHSGRDLRALGGIRLAAIGPATAEALRSYHLEPDVVPASYRSEELAEALAPLVAGQRVLLARADRGREVLREILQNVARVDQVAVYSQKDVSVAEPLVLEALARGRVDFVTLTSSNIARALFRILDEPGRIALASGAARVLTISLVTSATVRELGWPVAVEASVFTTEGLLDALVKLAGKSG
jgi:uroporphyrinogen III methyltransferase/synthase